MDKNQLNKMIKSVDSDPEIGFYIYKYIMGNTDKIESFLKKHDLTSLLFFPIGNIFYLVNILDVDRKELQRFKDNKFVTKYLNQKITLLEADKDLMNLLNIDEKQIDESLKVIDALLDLPFPQRYNDKTILKKKLYIVFTILEEKGFGQTEQINIILDLFEQEGFEDYPGGKSKERFERIRKTYQEPAIKLYKRAYGK